jgi:ABC-2 type transport system ATP-binding protein
MKPMGADSPVIDAHALTRRFGRFVAVRQVDVQVARGEVFGLLGANGAGKTTTIRMLCGLLAPSAGDIRVAGIDMVRRARRARAHIGYVAQGFALYADLSVNENLLLQAGLYGLHGRQRRERVQWALAHMGLAETRDEAAGTLPLGYQRRLSLAAALLHEPEVLFLDEPTSGVDPLARQHFWELIYDLAESGIGILVTTHYMDEALFCDRLSLMDAGAIVEQGTPEDLLTHPLPTPILELHATDSSQCVRLFSGWNEIQELVPHAGRLRLQLRAGADVQTLIRRVRDAAKQHGVAITRLERAQPDLEDVFVTVLAQAAEGERS